MDLLTFHFQLRVRRRCRHWTRTPLPALRLCQPGRHPLARGCPRNKPRTVRTWEIRTSSGPQWISLFGCGRCSTPADGNKPNVLFQRLLSLRSRLPPPACLPQAAPKKRTTLPGLPSFCPWQLYLRRLSALSLACLASRSSLLITANNDVTPGRLVTASPYLPIQFASCATPASSST
jgi:hypothetical protein